MTPEALEKELNSGKLSSSIYLLYGTERYMLENAVKKIRKSFGELVQGINYVILDDDGINEIIPNIETPAFGFEKKLIIIKNSMLFKKDGRKKAPTPVQERIINYIKEKIDMINESVIVVFVETAVDKNELYILIDKVGCVCNFEQLKPNQIGAKLKQICNAYKVTISDADLQYIIETCGTNMQDLINEIRKLIEYAGEGGNITKEAIDKLIIPNIENIVFDLTDNLGNKKIDKSLEILDNLIYSKEPLQVILIVLYGHFKKLYLTTLSIKNNKDVAYSLALKPNQLFLVGKYKKQASFFKEKDLKAIMKELIDLDYNSKKGNIDIDVGLRSILCRYCS